MPVLKLVEVIRAVQTSDETAAAIVALAAISARNRRGAPDLPGFVSIRALADLIGLDTCAAIMEVLHEGLGDPARSARPRSGPMEGVWGNREVPPASRVLLVQGEPPSQATART